LEGLFSAAGRTLASEPIMGGGGINVAAMGRMSQAIMPMLLERIDRLTGRYL